MKATASYLFAVAAAASLAAGCRDVKGEARPTPRPVKVMEARAPEPATGARYSVSIQPYEQIALAFKSGGYVESVLRRQSADGRSRLLQAGDYVRAGTVIAQVRQADYRERVAQATSSLHELEASQVKAQADLDRAHYLFAANALTRPERDAAQASFDANTARIASARASINLAEIALREAAIVTPSDGVILERKVEIGTLVGSGTTAFLLGEVGVVKAVFGVPDSMVHRITTGQPLAITTEAFPGSRFNGKVTNVAPSADSQSRVFDIELSIPNRDGRLRPGMIGAVELPGPVSTGEADLSRLTAVPLSAIVRSDKNGGEYSLFVVEGRGDQLVAHARAVTLGPVLGNLVAITSGLQPRERVVIMGASLVIDGEPIRVIP
jgi:RND family efflux transporter MFP subunit